MRITACRIEAFGPFRARVLDDLDHAVVVVQGPNEAGKTSLFHFFQEMLYGIAPPEESAHPYARAGETPALEGQLRYRLADGARRIVHRRLVSTPQARLGEAGQTFVDLQNRPLPAAAHVPREVFASVYALSGRTLGDLDGSAREEVQERLLRVMNAPHVRPAAEAVAALEEDAARLWTPAHPDDAASTEAAGLLDERRTLRQALRRARSHDRRRRALHRSIDDQTDRLAALEDERADLKAHLRRAERLRPVHTLLTRMDEHTERAGDLAPFEDVPETPRPVLRRLRQEIQKHEDAVARNEVARREAQAVRDAFTDEDRRVKSEADTVRAWTKRAPAHESRTEHREDLERDLTQLHEALSERTRRLFGVAWTDELAEALRALPDDELGTRVEAYRTADAEVEALQVRADTLARKVDRRKRLWPWIAAAAAGIVALAAGLASGLLLVAGGGAGLLLAGLVVSLNAWSYNRERTERLGDLDLDIEDQKEVRAERSAALAELLDDLPLPEGGLADPDREHWESLHELRRQAEEAAALRRQTDALASALAQSEDTVAELARRCGLATPDRPAGSAETVLAQTVAALERRLQEAEARHRKADAAETRLNRLHDHRRDLEPALEDRRQRYDRLAATLGQLDSAAESEEAMDETGAASEQALDAQAEELRTRRRAAARAEQAREALFRDHPDWKARRDEIRALKEDAGGWTYTDDEVVRMRERRESVADEILDLEKKRAREREEAGRLGRTPAPADVDSKLAAVQRRLSDVGRRRDRLALLAGVLRRADRTFRLNHQPDVVKEAGRYLRTITGGRYHRLVLEGEERRLHVCRAPRGRSGEVAGAADDDIEEEGEPQPVAPPLSQGLRDQVHLALRLALLDRFDQAQVALPVFLDEVFTTWDRRRRQQAYTVIEELAERRQVFVFTCHPVLSEELSRRLDAHRLLLGAPEKREEDERAAFAEAEA